MEASHLRFFPPSLQRTTPARARTCTLLQTGLTVYQGYSLPSMPLEAVDLFGGGEGGEAVFL
jgi:hypothetical protein